MPKAATKKGGKAEKRGKAKKGMFALLRSRRACIRVCTNKNLDPNAPKRGLSAYMFFANEQRENVREENPGIKFGESRLQ